MKKEKVKEKRKPKREKKSQLKQNEPNKINCKRLRINRLGRLFLQQVKELIQAQHRGLQYLLLLSFLALHLPLFKVVFPLPFHK
jgi:hypothetical protein